MILSGRVVTISRTRIHCGPSAIHELHTMLLMQEYRNSRIFVLVDPNTGKHCLPLLAEACPELGAASVFEIEGGEESKSMLTAQKIWDELLAAKADRHSLLINLGGGVVTDMGGFVASAFKRGIPYINIPTSLMGMADAAVGGKTGVNLHNLKNQLGFFYSPAAVFIDTRFLKTLPETHLRSGFAEIVKSALIGDAILWRRILRQGAGNIFAMNTADRIWQEMIMKTVTFKNRIVCQDFRELKTRKILNFGHTIGHAVESLHLGNDKKTLLHGDAVALGMIAETWLSNIKAGLSDTETLEIITFLKTLYHKQCGLLKSSVTDTTRILDELCNLLLHDKKNKNGEIRFTLIRSAGKPKINITAGRDEIRSALNTLFE